MKAVLQDRYGTSATLRIADVDTPVPAAGQVLLQVSAASIHIGDWHLMTGLPLLARLALGIRSPKQRVRGMDVAGRITAVGANVTSHQVGDHVFGTATGAFAEFAVAQADAVVPLPAETTAEQAAALPTSATTALHAVRDAGTAQAGQRVLVLGAAGGVGIFAVQIAKALGAHVTGVCSEPKRDLVRSLGADRVLDYRGDNVIGSERYDVIVDMGGRRPVRELRRALMPAGTLVIVGGEGGGRVLGGFERSLLAPLAGLFSKQKFRGLISVTKEANLLHLKAMVEAGTLRPIIDSTFALTDTPAAMRRLEEHLAVGKLVIAVHPE